MVFFIEENIGENSRVSTGEDARGTLENMGISYNVQGYLKSCGSCYLYQLMA